jgi:hypothetical protein
MRPYGVWGFAYAAMIPLSSVFPYKWHSDFHEWMGVYAKPTQGLCTHSYGGPGAQHPNLHGFITTS